MASASFSQKSNHSKKHSKSFQVSSSKIQVLTSRPETSPSASQVKCKKLEKMTTLSQPLRRGAFYFN